MGSLETICSTCAGTLGCDPDCPQCIRYLKKQSKKATTMNLAPMTERFHDLKIWPGAFAAVEAGAKRFEYRKDDRDFNVGDRLRLREWDPTPNPNIFDFCALGYTGAEVLVNVTYILRGHAVPNGYCVMSIERAN